MRSTLLLLVLLISSSVSASEVPLKDWLARFHENTREVMDELPPKILLDQQGEPVPPAFGQDEIKKGNFVALKNRSRSQILGTIPRAEAYGNDKFERLLEEPQFALRKLQDIEARGLLASTLDKAPWSDDYWPIFQGILGARYADPEFGWGSDWKIAYDYILAHPMSAIIAAGDESAIDHLSPSEKYDLITGSNEGRLTAKLWREGQRYFEATGEVQSWMGICHGWAPASYNVPRPLSPVTVPAADGGTPIRFYPADIKALASLLWANTDVPTRFVGGRCNVQEPQKDEVGRVTDPDCFDSNPGTWHLAVVNRIGVARESFVLDATFDYEVWNQPALGYSYSYFNPETSAPTTNLEEAVIPLSAYSKDKFKKYRSPAAVKVVGISMNLTYVVETSPRQLASDGPELDSRSSVRYIYDLELDAQNRVIGGEWYGNRHPDFLWTPVRGREPVSSGDPMIPYGSNWNSGQVPAEWRNPAARAARAGQPLAKVVKRLVELSRTGIAEPNLREELVANPASRIELQLR